MPFLSAPASRPAPLSLLLWEREPVFSAGAGHRGPSSADDRDSGLTFFEGVLVLGAFALIVAGIASAALLVIGGIRSDNLQRDAGLVADAAIRLYKNQGSYDGIDEGIVLRRLPDSFSDGAATPGIVLVSAEGEDVPVASISEGGGANDGVIGAGNARTFWILFGPGLDGETCLALATLAHPGLRGGQVVSGADAPSAPLAADATNAEEFVGADRDFGALEGECETVGVGLSVFLAFR